MVLSTPAREPVGMVALAVPGEFQLTTLLPAPMEVMGPPQDLAETSLLVLQEPSLVRLYELPAEPEAMAAMVALLVAAQQSRELEVRAATAELVE